MIKDHQISELNNQLRDTALKYTKTEQLRSRLAGVVAPFIYQANKEIIDLRYKCEVLRFERSVAQTEELITSRRNKELEKDIEQMDDQTECIKSFQRSVSKAQIESSEARHELRMLKRRARQNG